MYRGISFRMTFLTIIVCSLLITAGCAHIRERRHSSSAVEFLYPDKAAVAETPGIPVLTLPIRVGIAFVPASGSSYGRVEALTEKRKMELMQQVAGHFKKYPYVKDIELIPSAYLRPKGGFANLDQLRRLYGIDVIALVSYDQVQFIDQGFLSLTYWTIVGAYVIPGEKNDTHTMLDTVVYDVQSRKMLFRAPGVSHIKGRSTPVNLSEQLRMDSTNSLNEAAKDMINNLDQQLAVFRDKVKERPAEYKVVRSQGYTGGSTGGGSVDAILLLLLAPLLGGLFWTRRRA